MHIEIGLKVGAYTPEAFAYEEYLRSHGHSVRLCHEADMSSDAEIRIYFMGMRPWWRYGLKEFKGVVHEYQSLSVPPFSSIKDLTKKVCNSVPSGRIFLNRDVREHLGFDGERAPYIYRDMGISKNLYGTASKNPDYDLLYCGTLAGRQGLVEELVRLSSLGLQILVVGDVPGDMLQILRRSRNISFSGRIPRESLPQVFSRAKAGLNYTPDLFPFNIQTSTKTLEYCAAGLKLVSNRYAWVTDFANRRGFEPLWLDEIKSKDDFLNHTFSKTDVFDLEWDRVLDRSGLLGFLQTIANS